MNALNNLHHVRKDPQLLSHVQNFLVHRKVGTPCSEQQQAAWAYFYQTCSVRIRKYAFSCGATEHEVADCLQEVWTELLRRLPSFRFDPDRGKFDSWLFRVVQGKAADIRRQKRRWPQCYDARPAIEETVAVDSDPARNLEHKEIVNLAWAQARARLSECSFRILQMRLLERPPVGEVAKKLGRAQRDFERIRSALVAGDRTLRKQTCMPCEENHIPKEPAQVKADNSVSQNSTADLLAQRGGTCVDLIFQRLELGRRDLMAEWKVEWSSEGDPRPSLYTRRIASVAHAEICGPADFINANWPRIANAAIAAGVTTGIATIVATPSAALPIFQSEFRKHLHGKANSDSEEPIRIALSSSVEPNGPWCECMATP